MGFVKFVFRYIDFVEIKFYQNGKKIEYSASKKHKMFKAYLKKYRSSSISKSITAKPLSNKKFN